MLQVPLLRQLYQPAGHLHQAGQEKVQPSEALGEDHLLCRGNILCMDYIDFLGGIRHSVFKMLKLTGSHFRIPAGGCDVVAVAYFFM